MGVLAQLPVGDFQAFRVSTISSYMNIVANAIDDIRMSQRKDLTKEQRRAYAEDGYATAFGFGVSFGLNMSFYSTLATAGMGLMVGGVKGLKEMWKEEEDRQGNSIGTRAEFYKDFKGIPAVQNNWMHGKNMIVTKDDGEGNVRLVGLSSRDPGDEFYGLIMATIGQGRPGQTAEETVTGILAETFGWNMAINLVDAVSKGDDIHGRPLFKKEDSFAIQEFKRAKYLLEEIFLPPSPKALIRESFKQAQARIAEESGKELSKKDIKKLEVSASDFLAELPSNASTLLARTYKINMVEQIGYFARDFYKERESYDDLDQGDKERRIEQLKKLREGYEYLRKYSIFHKNPKIVDMAEENIRKASRGLTKTEADYIFSGRNPFEK